LLVVSHYATSAAVRQWRKLTATTRAQIDLKLKTFAETGVGNVKALKGTPGMRGCEPETGASCLRSKPTPSQFTQSETAAIFTTERMQWQKPAP
jgi:hypothetical protein